MKEAVSDRLGWEVFLVARLPVPAYSTDFRDGYPAYIRRFTEGMFWTQSAVQSHGDRLSQGTQLPAAVLACPTFCLFERYQTKALR
jgi:hypothetical protein